MEKLDIADFRNISSLTIEPGEGANIICADNAQGKTNLLEAIWLFCGARSFRGSKDAEFIRIGAEITALELAFFAEERSQTAILRYGGDKKYVSRNDIRLSRSGELAGTFCAVVFSPDHLWVVKQGPEKRRRLLDIGLCQIHPKYQKALEGYERILRQRSFVLKDARHSSTMLDTLDVWDDHAAEYGGYIASMRCRYVNSLSRETRDIYSGISGGKEELTLCYAPSFMKADENFQLYERDQWKKRMIESLHNSREEDIRMGATTVGPHRDDMIIEVDGMSARSYASQGQQRSCVLAIKLAECNLLTKSLGESPVVLLDDVMSELDHGRREYMLNSLTGRQVFITCCDSSAYEGLMSGKVFTMKKGTLSEGV